VLDLSWNTNAEEQSMDGPRACREDEFDEAIALINSVFRAESDQDIRTDYPLVFNQAGLEYMRIVRVDGQIVAHVPVAPRGIRVGGDGFTAAIISPTLSHPDYRHRGYATACLRDCVRIMEEREWPISVLWTQVQTFPFYQNSGWEAMSSQGYGYGLVPGDAERFEDGAFDIVPYDSGNGEHFDAIGRFHDAEPHRVVRTRADLAALLSLPKLIVQLAAQGGVIAGYVVVGKAMNKVGLLEAGGDSKAIGALVRDRLARLSPKDTLEVQTPLSPTPLGRLMESINHDDRHSIEKAALAGYQMVRINSLLGLLQGMEEHLRVRSKRVRATFGLDCSDSGEAVTISLDDCEVEIKSERSPNSLSLSCRQLAALIFGHHDSVEAPPVPESHILHRLFPFYFPVWALDRS
jgi:predicted N-acetyltransferase YhbS